MKAYKALMRRSDGTLGSPFINKSFVIKLGEWLKAERHKTEGFLTRPGWYACNQIECGPITLNKSAWNEVKGNLVWTEVEIDGYYLIDNPVSFSGKPWYVAKYMRVNKIL